MRGFYSLLAGLLVFGCSSDNEDSARTREEFCVDWAKAACTTETVSACQAASAEACRLKQQAFCQALVPTDFSDAKGAACIKAVGDAYKDADLTGAELKTVLELGAPCNAIIRGPSGQGETCTGDRNCDATKGLSCVLRGGSTSGTCQVPELVGPGQRCSALQQVCGEGFYCDTKNCIAVKELGESCTSGYECGSAALCSNDGACVAKLALGMACNVADECASGVCYSVNGTKTCVDRIRLSPAEAICADLR
ncbi:MAG: hypothetical protein ACOY0T_06445 [Myxococcota bacterium]